LAKTFWKLVDLGPKLIKVTQEKGKPALQTFLKYARVELQPPRFSELSQVRKGFGDLYTATQTQKWRTLTVKEATVNTLITVEVVCWFFVGEIIGKGTHIGYNVRGAVDYEIHI